MQVGMRAERLFSALLLPRTDSPQTAQFLPSVWSAVDQFTNVEAVDRTSPTTWRKVE